MLLQILFHPIIHLLFHKSWLVFEWIGSNLMLRFNRRRWLLCFQLWVDSGLKLFVKEHDNFHNTHCLLDFHETITSLASVMIRPLKWVVDWNKHKIIHYKPSSLQMDPLYRTIQWTICGDKGLSKGIEGMVSPNIRICSLDSSGWPVWPAKIFICLLLWRHYET